MGVFALSERLDPISHFMVHSDATQLFQESEKGNWHVPLAGEWTDESSRTWLCITRPGSCEASGRDNHKLVKSCDAKSISNDKLHGNSDSSPIRDKQTSTTGKRKERSVSPSRLDC